MATGTLPFRGESREWSPERLARDPVLAVQVNPELPTKLEDIIGKAPVAVAQRMEGC
jgi:hypothetical protein